MACGLLLSEVMQGEPRLLEFCLFVVHGKEIKPRRAFFMLIGNPLRFQLFHCGSTKDLQFGLA